ncbi:MAG TPA: RNA polymerase sigma factor [Kofleriaceae bacterium]|nr:RNA polymerase sigma factor [Kofleriaceae bacterium]
MSGAACEVTFGPGDRAFVYAVAHRILGSRADADDAAQEAMLRAFRYRGSFRGGSRYHTWLYRIAATTALGQLRRCRRSPLQLVDAKHERRLIESRADLAPAAADQLADAEDVEALSRALGELAPAYREVLLARVEASEGEVATRLGISVANVKIRAHRARQQLRKSLGCLAPSPA